MPKHEPQTYDPRTQVIHAGPSEPIRGAVVTPIFQSSTSTPTAATATTRPCATSATRTPPTHEVLHRKLAALEEGEAALATSSGMSAISSALLSVLSAGDHVLFQDTLYGGTAVFADRDLPRLGISVTKFDARRSQDLPGLLRPETRSIYTEALSNPMVQVPAHDAIVAFAKEHGLVSIIDATFATPVNFKPIPFGYDLVCHSATKYLNGHDDVVAGAVIGSEERIAAVLHCLKHFGGSLDPHACFLLERGIKTLALRITQQNENATALAAFLADHPAVAAVHYPGLEDHPDHQRGQAWFAGFGGVLSPSVPM